MVRPGAQETGQTISGKKGKDLVIGEALEIDYFYETLSSLKNDQVFKGRQEDAQEFLSFLLNRLHDEMIRCLESVDANRQSSSAPSSSAQAQPQATSTQVNGAGADLNDDEWQEVGKKNRAYVTRRVSGIF